MHKKLKSIRFSQYQNPKRLIAGLKWREKTQKTVVNINFSQIDMNIVNSFSCFLIGYLTTVNKMSLVKGFALWQLRLISARIKTFICLFSYWWQELANDCTRNLDGYGKKNFLIHLFMIAVKNVCMPCLLYTSPSPRDA